MKAKSMWQIVWVQFLEHRFAVASAALIAFFVAIALAAPVISWLMQIDPMDQNVTARYRPFLSRTPWPQEKLAAKIVHYCRTHPGDIQRIVQALGRQKTLAQHYDLDFSLPGEDFMVELSEFMDDDPALTAQLSSLNVVAIKQFLAFRNQFTTLHLFGTDELGRDILMRLIYGARVSMGIGVLVAASAALLGLLVGCLAGFYGGHVDAVCMRFTDALSGLPLLPVMIVVSAISLEKVPFLEGGTGGVFKLVFVLCLFSWMTIARLVRGAILSLKERDFIHAAKVLGARDTGIILTHLIPNVMAPLLVAVTLNVGQSILSEAALSFLGLGIEPPVPSWGNMLFNAQEIIHEAPLLAILPGCLILIVVVSFNFLGDGLQDAIDPKSIRR